MFKITKICAFENKKVILSTMNHDKYNNYALFSPVIQTLYLFLMGLLLIYSITCIKATSDFNESNNSSGMSSGLRL